MEQWNDVKYRNKNKTPFKPNIPLFHHSNIPIAELSGAKFRYVSTESLVSPLFCILQLYTGLYKDAIVGITNFGFGNTGFLHGKTTDLTKRAAGGVPKEKIRWCGSR